MACIAGDLALAEQRLSSNLKSAPTRYMYVSPLTEPQILECFRYEAASARGLNAIVGMDLRNLYCDLEKQRPRSTPSWHFAEANLARLRSIEICRFRSGRHNHTCAQSLRNCIVWLATVTIARR